MNETNFERLEAAGAVYPKDFNQAQVEAINNTLSSDEVTQLISIRDKLGGGKMMPDSDKAGPNTTF